MNIRHLLLYELREQAIPKYNIFINIKYNGFIKDHMYKHKLFVDKDISYHDLTFAFDLLFEEEEYIAQCKYVCDTGRYNKSMLVDSDEIIDNMKIYIYKRKMREDDLPYGIYEELHPFKNSINPETGEMNPEVYFYDCLDLIFPKWDGKEWIRGDICV